MSNRQAFSQSLAKRTASLLVLGLLMPGLSGCAGAVIDTATDAVIAVAKTPFKVGGAVVDIATDDD